MENAVLLILKCDGAITRVVSKEFRIHIDWHNDSSKYTCNHQTIH